MEVHDGASTSESTRHEDPNSTGREEFDFFK